MEVVKMNQKYVRQLHRWLGLIFSVSILMSAGSGVLHNVMSRTQPPPPAARPAGLIMPRDIKVAVSEALKHIADPALKLQAVSIRSIGGDPWYQLFIEGRKGITYVSAKTGEAGDMDEVYAAEIASAYLGGAAVRKTDYLTAYNAEYIAIFRILPVYRFDTGDKRGTRVYVSTMTGSVTRATDNQKQFEAQVFSNLHKFMFIKDKDVRDLVLTLTTLGMVCVALAGIILFVLTRPRRR